MPSPNPGGAKTHGRWIDEHGQAHPIVSGNDDDAAEAWRLMQARGIHMPIEPLSTTHVETKLAARMVREQRQHVDVVINNVPCSGRLSCDRLLPILLADGSSLTVHGPNYRKTYTGGAKA